MNWYILQSEGMFDLNEIVDYDAIFLYLCMDNLEKAIIVYKNLVRLDGDYITIPYLKEIVIYEVFETEDESKLKINKIYNKDFLDKMVNIT